MKMNELYPSNWLKKEDVPYPVTVTIRAVTQEQIKGERGNELKAVLHFVGALKPMILNKSNASVICSIYGDDTVNWSGKPIEVYNDPAIMFAGKVTGGIRLRAPQAGQRGPAANTFTYPQALSECEKHGINKDALVAALKAAGLQGWNDAKCSPMVHQLIAQKQADQEPSPFDQEFADAGAIEGDIPF